MPGVFRGAANETSVTAADRTWKRLGGEEVAEHQWTISPQPVGAVGRTLAFNLSETGGQWRDR